MTNLAALKKASSLDKLTKALQNTNNKFKEDERFWSLSVDKAGNGHAIIRFLDTPKADGEDGLPYVQIWSHSFEGPGGWYIENSLTTIGKPDPVSEHNTKLWKTNVEANQDKARVQKRKLTYISNIKVIKDTVNPENDGKVFLYKYGKKIFDKIQEKFAPSEEAIEAAKLEGETLVTFVPYDFWTGANFTLRARKVDGFRNYDKSDFSSQSPIAKTDAEIEKIWEQEHSLKEFLDPKNFKTHEELQAKLEKVLQLPSTSDAVAPRNAAPITRKPVVRAIDEPSADNSTEAQSSAEASAVITDDDALNYFEKLANA